mmetsp:Transcript_6485/g.8773  ORF Transcript_6485/g.8773 Transcript_6485/m.8773 type:complete len:112 (-) Transcript_6485:1418-1753(-)
MNYSNNFIGAYIGIRLYPCHTFHSALKIAKQQRKKKSADILFTTSAYDTCTYLDELMLSPTYARYPKAMSDVNALVAGISAHLVFGFLPSERHTFNTTTPPTDQAQKEQKS